MMALGSVASEIGTFDVFKFEVHGDAIRSRLAEQHTLAYRIEEFGIDEAKDLLESIAAGSSNLGREIDSLTDHEFHALAVAFAKTMKDKTGYMTTVETLTNGEIRAVLQHLSEVFRGGV